MKSHEKVINPIDAHVGRRLALARYLCGLSQGRLGALVGVTFQQIQKYENGTNRISASNLLRLANALNVSIDWFFEGAEAEDR
ncbi:MAG: helix-turn-helix transcriptional regulator [Alphaproteobacteria bacterium]|nr:helix-turn-helix transcriptional regulator [Alphaproteobacteria bacterium]MDD3289007.1 helix-turn-helix transcriptional regulator [Alphaproteobacteria bacterium]